MNYQLLGSVFGSLLAAAALMPDTSFFKEPATAVNISSSPTPKPSPTLAQVGNLTISTVPGNTWVKVNDYVYTPRVAPVLSLEGWRSDLPVRAVVRDARNTCIGRLTNESGKLRFIFVEADPPMCGNVPGPRMEG